MTRRNSPLVHNLCLTLMLGVAGAAWALPSAKDLLNSCTKSLELNCQTQHVVTKTTTVIAKTGEAPVTMIQTMESWKKKPDMMKNLIDNGITRQETIGKGDYLYIRDPLTLKFAPVKSPFKIDPFQKLQNSLSSFDEAVVAETGDGNFMVTLRGGNMPKSMDRTEVFVDGAARVVTKVLGWGKDGSEALKMEIEYAEVGGKKYVKKMTTGSTTDTYGVSSTTETLSNEIDEPIDDAMFEVGK